MIYTLLILAYFGILFLFIRFGAFLKECDDSVVQMNRNSEYNNVATHDQKKQMMLS